MFLGQMHYVYYCYCYNYVVYKWNSSLFGWICCCFRNELKSKEDETNLKMEVAMSNTNTGTRGTSSAKEDTTTETTGNDNMEKPSMKDDMSLPLAKTDSNPIPKSDKIDISIR